MQLFNVPLLVLVVPDVRHRAILAMFDLADSPAITEERPDIGRILVCDFIMFVPGMPEKFQMM